MYYPSKTKTTWHFEPCGFRFIGSADRETIMVSNLFETLFEILAQLKRL